MISRPLLDTRFSELRESLTSRQALQTTVANSSLVGHSYIRSALTIGSHDLAQELLHQRTSSTLRCSWIDHFFFSRLHAAQGDFTLAAKRFKQAYDIAVQLHATARIEFEMRCATEMSPLQWSVMIQQCQLGIEKTSVNRHRWNSLVFCGESRPVRQLREHCSKLINEQAPITVVGATGSGVNEIARWFASHRTPGGHIDTLTVSEGADQVLIEALLGIGDSSSGLLERCVHGTMILEEIQNAGRALQNVLLDLCNDRVYVPINGRVQRKLQTAFVFTADLNEQGHFEHHHLGERFIEMLDRHFLVVPSLDQRREDLEPITRAYVKSRGSDEVKIDAAFLKGVKDSSWPGNFPQLTAYIRQHFRRDFRLNGSRSSGTGSGVESITAFFAAPSGSQTIDERVVDATRSPRDKRLDTLRSLLVRHERLTRKQVMNSLGVSPATATKYLQELCEEGSLVKVEPTPAPRTHYYARPETAQEYPTDELATPLELFGNNKCPVDGLVKRFAASQSIAALVQHVPR